MMRRIYVLKVYKPRLHADGLLSVEKEDRIYNPGAPRSTEHGVIGIGSLTHMQIPFTTIHNVYDPIKIMYF